MSMEKSKLKDKLKDILKGMKSIRIGGTLEIFSPSQEKIIHTKAKKAMDRGQSVTWEDGRTEWITFDIVTDLSKQGSDQYTWKGDKVKYDKTLHTKKNGKVTKKIVKQIFKDYE